MRNPRYRASCLTDTSLMTHINKTQTLLIKPKELAWFHSSMRVGIWRRIAVWNAQFDLLNKVFHMRGQPVLARFSEQYHGLC